MYVCAYVDFYRYTLLLEHAKNTVAGKLCNRSVQNLIYYLQITTEIMYRFITDMLQICDNSVHNLNPISLP